MNSKFIIQDLVTRAEAHEAMLMYYRHAQGLPCDFHAGLAEYDMRRRSWPHVRCVRLACEQRSGRHAGGRVLGAVTARLQDVPFIKGKVLYQEFCDVSPDLSARDKYAVMKLIHEDLIAKAEFLGVQFVWSGGSWNDPKNTFARMVESFGWHRTGYTCFTTTKHYNPHVNKHSFTPEWM